MVLPHRYPRAFAKLIPVQRAGSNPGPYVTAIASILGVPIFKTDSKNRDRVHSLARAFLDSFNFRQTSLISRGRTSDLYDLYRLASFNA